MSIKYHIRTKIYPSDIYTLAEIEIERETPKRVKIKSYQVLAGQGSTVYLNPGGLANKKDVYDTLPEAIKVLDEFIKERLRYLENKRDRMYSDLLALSKLGKEKV